MHGNLNRRRALGALAGALALASPRREARSQRPQRIFMITWRGWEDGSQGFKDYLQRRNVAVELIVRDAARSRERVEAFVAEAKAIQPDLVYTWGTTTALTTFGRWDEADPARYITDIPGVFNIVSTPVASGLVRSLDEPPPNLTGTLYLVPVETQFRTIESYQAFERIGMVYNELESNSRQTVAEVGRLGEAQGFRTFPMPVPLDDAGAPDPGALPATVQALKDEQVDWMYIPPDSFLNINRDVLTASARDAGLPTFAAAENFVRDAAGLVGLVSRYYNVGQYAGYLAEQILLAGKSPGEIPIRNLERFSLLVNLETARQLQFYPPLAMLAIAEFV